MITYEQIYNDLCERYPADDVHAFFNEHERRVRHRVVQEILVPTRETADIRFKKVDRRAGG